MMERLRQTLGRLGWPVDLLTDEEILHGMSSRWFHGKGNHAAVEATINAASALGMVTALAREGNLDALCWGASDGAVLDSEGILGASAGVWDRPETPAREEHCERRRSPRRRAREYLTWSPLGQESTETAGWLVCRAAEGIAFIAEVPAAPELRSTIRTRVHSQSGEVVEIGWAVVVRKEPLNDELMLVCAELETASTPPDP